jgi:hypothetical protein
MFASGHRTEFKKSGREDQPRLSPKILPENTNRDLTSYNAEISMKALVTCSIASCTGTLCDSVRIIYGESYDGETSEDTGRRRIDM